VLDYLRRKKIISASSEGNELADVTAN